MPAASNPQCLTARTKEVKINPDIPGDTAVLFYDGLCPLCAREMAKLGRLKSDKLFLADIHQLPPDANLPTRETLLETLHLRLPGGQFITGVDANVAAWQYTRYGVWLRWIRWPLVHTLARKVYDYWARKRYSRLYSQPCTAEKESCDASH